MLLLLLLLLLQDNDGWGQGHVIVTDEERQEVWGAGGRLHVAAGDVDHGGTHAILSGVVRNAADDI